ncbi:MAG TPA: hypothetical protein VN676_13980, partial [Steroidobacteraceae bacterium]|nr:hypothetical protein [Steroidobacteraceae bacterium]
MSLRVPPRPHAAGGEGLLRVELCRLDSLIDPRRHRVDERHDHEQSRSANGVEFAEPQHDR